MKIGMNLLLWATHVTEEHYPNSKRSKLVDPMVLRFRSLAETRRIMKPNTLFRPLHPQVRIGHIHLKVSDLERSLAFYHDVLGFEITQRYGREAAFLSAGG